MTKTLFVAFLSVFMLKATINAAYNTNPNEEMTGSSRYSISTVSAQYQNAIEKAFREKNVTFSHETFVRNNINYEFLNNLMGTVPDDIAYGDTGGKNRYYYSIGRVCPDTPRKARNRN